MSIETILIFHNENKCPKCEGKMNFNEEAPVYYSFPPQYNYKCENCGFEEYRYEDSNN